MEHDLHQLEGRLGQKQMQFGLWLPFGYNLGTGSSPSMNKCELDLEEDALIILEQLEPQGTLYSLKNKSNPL